MYYYQRLKDIREDKEMTQEEIAQILEMSREQYGRYERGKIELPMHHFMVLSKYYNISLDYLSGLTDTPRPLKVLKKRS